MHLTNQMKAELGCMKEHITETGYNTRYIEPLLREEIFEEGSTFKSEMFITENAKQMRTYKLRLENLLCETDLKEQVH